MLLLAQLASRQEQHGKPELGFLTTALGAPQHTASLVRKPAKGVRLRVADTAEFRRGDATIALSLAGATGAWQRHLRGATRTTPWGSESIVFRGEYGLEHYSRVLERQGKRTWRWALDTNGLTPRLAGDGGVDFFDGSRSAGLRVEPATIFDDARRDVTPEGTRWSLRRADDGWTLALALDDTDLPLPYVIDPNVSRTAFNTAGSADAVTSLAITKPGNVGDILIAQIAVRNNATINAPANWNAVGTQQTSGTGHTQAVFWATNSAVLSTTFTWTGAVHAAGEIAAYADVHPTSPIDASAQTSGTSAGASAPSVTTNFANSMIVPLYSASGNVTATQDASQSVTQFATAISTGTPAGSRMRVTGADGLQAAAGASGAKTATLSASAAWSTHNVTLRREPPDGLGTMSPDRANVAASSTGNTLVWTYTAPADGLVNGEVRVTVPASWSAPSSTGTTAGFTQVSAGTLSFSSQVIIVSSLTLAGSASFTITYGSTASGGPGATASGTTGAVTWTTQQKGTVGGTLTNIATQPTVTQNAANGSGTISASRSNVAASSTANTITFTYTAAAGGMANGSVSIDIPASWSAPSTTGTANGYTTSTTGTISVAGQTITVSGLTLAAAATFDIAYGSTAGGGSGATASSTLGALTWQAKQRSVNVGTLTNLASSPSITQNAPNGSGTASANVSAVTASSTGNTVTFTYTVATGGMSSGSISVDVPASWSAPSTTGTANGYTTSTAGTVSIAGQTITVSGITLSAAATFDVVYGSTAGGGSGSTASSATGATTWQVNQRSVDIGTLASLASSPSITQYAANGSGTATANVSNVAASSTGNTLTFTYTAAAGGMSGGSISIDVPAGWSAPSTIGTNAGYTTSTSGAVSVAGQTITVSSLTLAGAGTVDVVYGATSGGGPGATATATTGAATWQVKQRSLSSGTLANLGASPSITVNAANGSGTLATAATNVAASSTGNTLTFTYTAATGGMSSGSISVDVPAGWSAPSTIGTNAGYTTSTAGTVGVAGQTITISGLTLAGGATVDVVYGATSGGGPGATATATTGAATWQGKQRSTSSGTLANLGASPSITVNAANGSGTLTTPTTNVLAGSTGNTITFTYTAATGGMANGSISIDVPAGWSAPSTTGTAAGFSTSSAGTLSVGGQTITVSSLTLAGGATLTVVYGATSGGGPGASATSSTGAQTWQGKQRSTSSGTLANLGASPSIAVDAADGTGTASAAPTNVGYASIGNTVTITYTASVPMTNGSISVDVPTGWSAPSTTASSAGYTTSSAGTVGVAGQTITVSGLTLAASGTVAVTYGSTAGGGPGAGAPASAGAQTWLVKQKATAGGTLTNLGASPSVTVNAQPATPTGLATTPASPANDTLPEVTGIAPAGSTVRLYTTNDCTGSIAASGSAATFGGAGITVAVTDNATTSLTARAIDALGGVSACSTAISYTADSIAPAAPSALATSPASPANNNDPRVTGSAEAGSTVTLYATADCTGGSAASGSAATFAGAGLDPANVLDNSTTSYTAKATDAAGNVSGCSSAISYVEDSTAPAAPSSLATTPASPANNNDPRVTGSAEAGSTVTLYATADCTGVSAASGSAATFAGAGLDPANVADNSSTTYTAKATDTAGNVSVCSAPLTYVEDSTAPTTSVTFPAAGGSYRNAAWSNPSGTAADTGGAGLLRIEISIRRVSDNQYWNGTAFADASESWRTATGTASWSLTFPSSNFPADGDYVFRVRAVDNASNTETAASYTVTIDNAAPNTSITAQPANPTNATGASFSFTSTEGGSTFECKLDGGLFAACTSPKSYTGLADGSHTFEVRATDAAGNVDGTPATFIWTVDTAAPNTTISSSPAASSNSANADFSFSSSEGGSTFECKLDGGLFAPCTSPKSYTGLTDGSHTFQVRATDAAGNTDATPASFTWTIDTAAPSSTASFPVNTGAYNIAGWNAGCVPSGVCGTASDAGSGLDRVEVSIQRGSDSLYWNGTAFAGASEDWRVASGTASWNLAIAAASFPSDGSYTIRVRARDLAGNVEAPASRTFTIDTSAPDTAIDSGPANPTNSQDPSFAFSGGPGGVSFECRLDGGSWGACTSPKGYTGLAAGSHTFEVRAQDGAGNLDPTPATQTWTIDLTAPTSAIGFPANGGAYNGASWSNPSGTASDGVGLDRVEISLQRVSSSLYWNGTAFADASENWRTATGTASWSLAFAGTNFPADGDYAIRARAVDAAGNVEAASSRTFTVDTVPPQTTIDTSPATPISSANASFTFSADQPGSSFECRIDGGAWATCTSPRNYTSLAEGSHTFEVKATDVGGNVDPSPAAHTWVVDTVPPVATMDDPGQYLKGTVNLTSTSSDTGGTGVASVGFQRSPAGAGTWSGIAAAWDTTGVANALYDLRVIATDFAGNSSSFPALTGRWVDNLKPTVSIVDPGPVTGTVTVNANAADAHSGVKQVQLQVFAGGSWVSLGTDTSAPYQASWATASFSDGAHDLRAIATDYTDNVETSAVVSVVVDNTDPTISFTAPVDLGSVNAAAANPFTLVAAAADLGSGVDQVEFFFCTAGGAACTSSSSLGTDNAGPYTAAWPLPASDGTYHLKATARDRAGRNASVVIQVTIDRTTPDTSLLTNPGNPSRDSTPDFTFSSTETGSTFECRVDGGAWAPCATPHTTAPLADGPRTFDVRAIDAAGNIDATPAGWAWLLDTTPPTATMNDPGANLRATIALTSVQSDPGATPSGIVSVQYQYSVADANIWVNALASWNTTTVTDGLYDLRVVVTDNAGNETQAAAVEDRRVDNSPPATAIDDPGANLRAVVTMKGTASDTGSGVANVVFEVSPDDATWSTIGSDNSDPYESPFATTTLPDGLYFFRTVATDVAGNVTMGASVGPRRIDNTPPTASLNDPGPNLRGAVNLSSVVDDPPGPPVASGVSVVMYEALIGSVWTGISQTWATTSVPDGVYDLRVVVADVAGNQTTSAVVGGRRVDNTPPSTSHNAPGSWQPGAVTVSLGPSDGGSGVANTQYSVDGGGWNSGTSVNVSGDGIHTISFFSTDVAGNIESPKTATVMIDSTPPDPGASDPGNYLRGTVNLTANPSTGGPGGAAVTQVEFQHKRSSDSTWTSLGVDTTDPYGATWATTPADDGSWDLRFIVTDEAGNTNTTDLASKIVDNTAPAGSVASPLSGSTVSGSITLGVSASDANPIAGVEYFVNGGSIGTAGSAPFQMSWNSASGGDGGATIYAVISDVAGNTTTTGTVNITVDNFPPGITMSAPAANVSGTINLTASADGDTVQVTFERRPAGGGGWTTVGTALGAPWSAAFDTTAVGDGNYELRALAVDAGGNSGMSGVVTTRVDNTDPSGLLTAPGGGATVGSSAVPLAATGSDGGSGVTSVVWQARQSGGGGFADVASDSGAPFAATWDVTSLPSVAHDLRIVVTDMAGNTFTSSSITVNIDSTAPTVSLNNPGSPLSGTVALSASTAGDANTVTFGRSPAGAASWTAIAADGTAPYGASFDTTAVADGLYDLRAVVSDSVGNTSQDVIAGVRIDNFVPIVVSSVPGNGSIVASANQITITASEDIASVTGGTLDGAPSVMPLLSGAVATFNVGSLSDGAHTLQGTVHDAAGKSSSFSVTFMVGVPAPAPSTGGGTFDPALPLVPAPTAFAAKLEADGSLTLRWKPSRDAAGEPFATLLYIDGIATQTLAPGENQVNLGPFDPADMRVFTIVAVDGDGMASPASAGLRSTSVLAGKTLDEARAILVNRGFAVGVVRGNGTVVVAPATALMAPLGAKIDLELGTPTSPQARLVFDVVATKRYAPAARKKIALRLKTTRAATITATLLDPKGKRAYRWRFPVKAGITIKQLTMPPSVTKPGRYRLVFSVESGRETIKKSIVVVIVKKTVKPVRPKKPLQIVLASTGNNGREIERGLSKGMEVVPAAVGEDAWSLTGASDRNVEVIVVDVDRYGLQLVRDLRLVFPTVRILGLTNDPRRLVQAVRAGATIAVPRSTPAKDLAKLIQRLANRRPY